MALSLMTEISLREYFEAQNRSLRELIDLRFNESQRALGLATEQLNQRFDQVNDFREQVLGERGMYPRREVLDALGERVGRLERLIPVVALLSAIIGATMAYLVEHGLGVK
jgi:hypothetical protein